MRIGIDVQVVADGNRSGLYTCLRSLVGELSGLVDDPLSLFANVDSAAAAQLSAAMGGAAVRAVPRQAGCGAPWRRWSAWNRVDVLLHNLHGVLPPSPR